MEVDEIEKIIDSKLVNKIYEEGVSPAMKQVGSLTEDTAKAFRLFTAPIQLLASGQDRLEIWLEKIRTSVPTGKQQEASPEIAGPVLMNLRFMDDSNELHLLYLNLLKAAIHSDKSSLAHPGYIKAIEHMAPKDALLLQIIFETAPFQWVVRRPDVRPRPLAWLLNNRVEKLTDWNEDDIQSGIEVLSGLSLIKYEEEDVREIPDEAISYQSLRLWVTEYGERFIRICMPDGLPHDIEPNKLQ